MPNVRVSVEGLKEARTRIDDVGIRARQPEPVLRSAGTFGELLASEQRRFGTTAGWRRDTAKWVADKQRHGWDQRTLRKTGELERQLTQGGPSIIFSAWNGTMTFGIRGGRSTLYYAAPLARGARGTAKRRMVRIDRVATYRISGRISRYITYGIVTG